jgi:hypothetical protein
MKGKDTRPTIRGAVGEDRYRRPLAGRAGEVLKVSVLPGGMAPRPDCQAQSRQSALIDPQGASIAIAAGASDPAQADVQAVGTSGRTH